MNERSQDDVFEPDNVARQQQDHDADGRETDPDATVDLGVDIDPRDEKMKAIDSSVERAAW